MSHNLDLSIEECNVLAEHEVLLGELQEELEREHEDINDQILSVKEGRSVLCNILRTVEKDGFLWMNAH